MNLQEIAGVLGTEFWKEFTKRLEEKRAYTLHDFYSERIDKPESWIHHAQYRGMMEVFDWVRDLPNKIIQDLKKGTLG